MKQNLLIILLLTSFSIMAGSGAGIITCESKSGRTKLEIYTSDVAEVYSITLQIDSHELVIDRPNKESIVYSKEHNVLTVTAIKSGKGADFKFFEFYGIPTSFNFIKKERHSTLLKFDAIMGGSDPRPNEWRTPDIELGCTLKYEI